MHITIHLAVYLVQVLPTHSLRPLIKVVLFIMIMLAFVMFFLAAKVIITRRIRTQIE